MISPVSNPCEIMTCAWSNRRISTLRADNDIRRRIDNPHSRLLIYPRQRGCRDVDHRPGTGFDLPIYGRAEPHSGRRIRQADLDLERPGDRIGLRRDLTDTALRRYLRIVRQADGDLQVG